MVQSNVSQNRFTLFDCMYVVVHDTLAVVLCLGMITGICRTKLNKIGYDIIIHLEKNNVRLSTSQAYSPGRQSLRNILTHRQAQQLAVADVSVTRLSFPANSGEILLRESCRLPREER